MDWVLSCTEPKRVCWGPQYTASLVKFSSTSAGPSRPHAGATPVGPRARTGRSPPDSYWLDDPAMIKALAREPPPSYEPTISPHQFPLINTTPITPRNCHT